MRKREQSTTDSDRSRNPGLTWAAVAALIVGVLVVLPLIGTAAGPPATVSAPNGTPQTTAVNTTFGVRLVAWVRDAQTNGVPGVTVTFTAPSSGPSAAFSGSTTAAVVTDGSGLASAPVLTANGQSGSYTVTAAVPGVATPATYSLTNTGGSTPPPPPPLPPPTAPSNLRILSGAPSTSTTVAPASGTPQSTTLNSAFAAALRATVLDQASSPISGVTVTFTAPASGATARFSGSATATAVSDAGGVATAPTLTANGVAGSYVATASVAGATPANFSLTNSTVVPPPSSQLPWQNVTPAGISFGGGDNFGVQDVLADPVAPGMFYLFTCYQGMWRSTDYGLTWAKRSANGGPLDFGKNWGSEIAPNGSYMLTGSGNNSNYRDKVLKSSDGGVTWTASASVGMDPYSIDIDRSNQAHAIASGHDSNHLIESMDSGATWSDRGAMGGASQSNYVHFLDSNTILAVSDGDNGAGAGTWRGTKSGSTWTWARVSNQQHYHGFHQLFIDPSNGTVYSPGAFGIEMSTNNGLTWSMVSTIDSGSMIATATTFYASRSYPINGGSFDPNFQVAPRASGTGWVRSSTPSGMTNGPKRWAISFNAATGHYVIVTGNWVGGVWRFVE